MEAGKGPKPLAHWDLGKDRACFSRPGPVWGSGGRCQGWSGLNPWPEPVSVPSPGLLWAHLSLRVPGAPPPRPLRNLQAKCSPGLLICAVEAP